MKYGCSKIPVGVFTYMISHLILQLNFSTAESRDLKIPSVLQFTFYFYLFQEGAIKEMYTESNTLTPLRYHEKQILRSAAVSSQSPVAMLKDI